MRAGPACLVALIMLVVLTSPSEAQRWPHLVEVEMLLARDWTAPNGASLRIQEAGPFWLSDSTGAPRDSGQSELFWIKLVDPERRCAAIAITFTLGQWVVPVNAYLLYGDKEPQALWLCLPPSEAGERFRKTFGASAGCGLVVQLTGSTP